LSHPNVSALGKVSLSHNRLTRIPAQIRRFPQLDHIDLDYNNISFIHSGAFKFTKTLQKLSLKSNLLKEIEAGAFQGIVDN
jgi:Leucine-rich repeat (LRR) protein